MDVQLSLNDRSTDASTLDLGKYDPAQPRVPAGSNRESGRWTDQGDLTNTPDGSARANIILAADQATPGWVIYSRSDDETGASASCLPDLRIHEYPMTEDWHSILPDELFKLAYKESPGEQAWPKFDALRVAGLLHENGYHILGVDAWLPTRPGPTPLIRDRDERNPTSCTDYIKTFEWMPVERRHEGLQPYFAFRAA